MTDLDPHLRRRAREEADGWAEVGYLSAVGTGLAAIGAPIVGSGGLLAIPLGAFLFFGAIGYVGLRKRHAARRKEDDPPRDDYFEATEPELPQFDLGVFGFDPLGQATARLLDVASRASAYELAMVLANERALGARQNGVIATASARLDEASGFGAQATALNQEVELLAGALSRLVERLQPLEVTGEQVRLIHESLHGGFYDPPLEHVEVLRKIGVSPEEEQRYTDPSAYSRSLRPGDDYFGALAMALMRAGQQTGAFAMEYLQTHDKPGPALA